ncbi:gilgamesh-like protein [Dermatophagoides farinae]|uniref:Gilgamesh-like protein n=1 Tax=Dermatophagoides farinae TaxID=6954 RepID=A0A9D4P496_DERFA|nr:gilgamesh-like protein [Dermatophagoides farinae]
MTQQSTVPMLSRRPQYFRLGTSCQKKSEKLDCPAEYSYCFERKCQCWPEFEFWEDPEFSLSNAENNSGVSSLQLITKELLKIASEHVDVLGESDWNDGMKIGKCLRKICDTDDDCRSNNNGAVTGRNSNLVCNNTVCECAYGYAIHRDTHVCVKLLLRRPSCDLTCKIIGSLFASIFVLTLIYWLQLQEPNFDYLYEYYKKYNKNTRQAVAINNNNNYNYNDKNNNPKSPATKQSESESLIGKYIGNSNYMVVKYLGGGSFGNLYLGQHREQRSTVAIKIEKGDCDKPQLFLEYRFYKKLSNIIRGVPKIYTFGPIDDGRWNALVMELLGPSLEKMFENCGGRFSLRTVIQLTIQMIHLFRNIHESGILYRDTKPANFLLGQPNSGKWWLVHVVDLGFCKEWRREDGSHIIYQENKPFTGTVRYMSINNNFGREQSRRDDLEALVYMLIYFYKGRLPWQGIVANSIIERYRLIAQCKMNTPITTLCSDMPEEFTLLLQSIRSLHFEERPSYSGLLTPFFQLLARDFALEMNDRVYDWTMSQEIKSPILQQSVSYSTTKTTTATTMKNIRRKSIKTMKTMSPSNRMKLGF